MPDPIWQIKKLRLKEIKQLAQCHKGTEPRPGLEPTCGQFHIPCPQSAAPCCPMSGCGAWKRWSPSCWGSPGPQILIWDQRWLALSWVLLISKHWPLQWLWNLEHKPRDALWLYSLHPEMKRKEIPKGPRCCLSMKVPFWLQQEGWEDQQLKPLLQDRHFSEQASKEQKVSVIQSCTTLCNSTDCSPPDSVHGILQARILKWVAIPFSRGSSWPSDRTRISCIAGGFFTCTATRKTQKRSQKGFDPPKKWIQHFHFLSHAVRLVGSQFPYQGLNPGPQQTVSRVPPTGSPGNFLQLCF